DAVAVGREDLSAQLVEAAALRGFGEVLEQPAADAFPASAALDVQHGLGDLRVVLRRIRVRDDAGPPDDLAVGLGDQQRVSPAADPLCEVVGRMQTRLGCGDAVADAL